MFLEAQQVSKKFAQETALEGITFEAERGQIIGVVGLNGAGKSTLLKILSGLSKPSTGKIKIEGKTLKPSKLKIRRKIAYLSENSPLYEEMRVTEFLSFQAKLKKIPFIQRRKKIKDAISLCHLNSVRKNQIHHLSKGFKQRVSLANVILNQPDLLILDEPTNGLDAQNSQIILEILQKFKEDKLIFISSHFLNDLEILCDKILFLHKGKLKSFSKKETLFSKIQGAQILFLQIQKEKEEVSSALQNIGEIKKISLEKKMEDGWNRYQILFKGSENITDKIYQISIEKGWKIREISKHIPSFKETFKEIIFTYE